MIAAAGSHRPLLASSRRCCCAMKGRSSPALKVAAAAGASPARAQQVPVQELLAAAQEAAEAGAKVVHAALDKPRSFSIKGASADIVTETDKLSEEAVLKVLRQRYPDHAVLGEEGGVVGNTESDYLWAVDPIDGTTNFAHGYGAFAVSVGVLRKDEVVAGCVIEFTGGPHAWATRTFAAAKGQGATCNGKPIRVSDVSDVRRSLLVTGFGYDHDEAWLSNMQLFQDLTDVSQGVRRLGAASVDLCHVALGICEAYWEYRLKPWDVAAGIIVVTEAGGRVTRMDGKPYTVFERSMLATNGAIHDALLSYTQPQVQAVAQKGIDLSEWYRPHTLVQSGAP